MDIDKHILSKMKQSECTDTYTVHMSVAKNHDVPTSSVKIIKTLNIFTMGLIQLQMYSIGTVKLNQSCRENLSHPVTNVTTEKITRSMQGF